MRVLFFPYKVRNPIKRNIKSQNLFSEKRPRLRIKSFRAVKLILIISCIKTFSKFSCFLFFCFIWSILWLEIITYLLFFLFQNPNASIMKLMHNIGFVDCHVECKSMVFTYENEDIMRSSIISWFSYILEKNKIITTFTMFFFQNTR